MSVLKINNMYFKIPIYTGNNKHIIKNNNKMREREGKNGMKHEK